MRVLGHHADDRYHRLTNRPFAPDPEKQLTSRAAT
jgi:hypothetical protein